MMIKVSIKPKRSSPGETHTHTHSHTVLVEDSQEVGGPILVNEIWKSYTFLCTGHFSEVLVVSIYKLL